MGVGQGFLSIHYFPNISSYQNEVSRLNPNPVSMWVVGTHIPQTSPATSEAVTGSGVGAQPQRPPPPIRERSISVAWPNTCFLHFKKCRQQHHGDPYCPSKLSQTVYACVSIQGHSNLPVKVDKQEDSWGNFLSQNLIYSRLIFCGHFLWSTHEVTDT